MGAFGEWLAGGYAWLKALHVIAVIAWMAGLLYLPRLYVYHVSAETGSVQSETFKIMECRLLYAIMNPAMTAAWLFALLMMLANPGLFSQGWFQAKILLVMAMTGAHMIFARWRKDFAADANTRSSKFYRIVNEAPTLLFIVVVILAIVEPF